MSAPAPAFSLRDRLEAAVSVRGGPSSDFDLNAGIVLPEGRSLRDAAVLIAVIDSHGGPEVLLTKRSARLKHHPGQVAFPGGKLDEGDANATAAALREAHEEVGLDPGNVDIVGALPPHETVTGFTVTPVLAMAAPFDPTPEAGEVAEAFTVPFAHIADPANFAIERRRWRGKWRRYYAVPFGPYYVWGATARILRGLAERLPQ
ncbi:MAG: CoA pyrophosphatase [Pseudomonadota bacterium]